MTELAILPMGRIPFSNRTNEYRLVESYFEAKVKKKKGVIFKVPKGSGFTRFLEEIHWQSPDEILSVLVNAESEEPDLIIKEFFRTLREANENLSKIGLEKLSAQAKRILDFLVAVYADFEGPGANTIGKITNAMNGGIRSVSFDKFRKSLKELPTESGIVFLIDNAEKREKEIFTFIKNTFSDQFSRVKFILGFCDDSSDNAERLLNNLNDVNLTMDLVNFKNPDVHLLEEILKRCDKEIPKKYLEELLLECSNNMHKIITKLRSCIKQRELTPADFNNRLLAKYVCLYLKVANQGLPVNDLRSMFLTNPSIYYNGNEAALKDAISSLDFYIIEKQEDDGSRLVQLIRKPDFEFSEMEELAAQQSLYGFYQTKNKTVIKSLKTTSLLYQLSKSIDPVNHPKYAEEMVSLALVCGNIELAINCYDTVLPLEASKTFNDFYLHVAFLITAKRYQTALKVLMSPPNKEWNTRRLSRLFKVVALNRCRFQNESLKVIDSLLKETLSDEELALTVSFKISGLIHEGYKERAWKAFVDFKKRLIKARNYGYFLRNGAASSTDLGVAVSITNEAIQEFQKKNDLYGENTAISNKGAFWGLQKDMNKAYQYCNEALEVLQTFGMHHIEESMGNKALSAIYLNKRDEAEQILKNLICIATENVPKYYALLNLGLLFALQGKKSAALKSIINGYKLAIRINVMPHRQRFYCNAALITTFIKPSSTIANKMKKLVEANPFVHSRELTKKALYLIENKTISAELLLASYLPPFMFYWSQEPIYVVSKNLVSPETSLKNF